MTVQGLNQVTSRQVQSPTISDDKLIDAISKVNANQIEDIATIVAAKTIYWLENERDLGKHEKKKMFQFESEYNSLTNLTKPIQA